MGGIKAWAGFRLKGNSTDFTHKDQLTVFYDGIT